MSEVQDEFAKDPEAGQVLGFMAAGRWRKARDAAKELCKRDRGRYLDLLIKANVGLVREMLGKGLLKEAKTVLDYLASFAPADTMMMLRAEMAAPTGKRQVEAVADSGGAGWWVAALRADEVLMKGGTVFPADQAAVDLLVTDSYEVDGVDGDGRATRLAAELKAVRAACAATGEGHWEEAKDALRGLPRQSIFWQWRIFLRGVRCVFEEEAETARRCFAQLPEISALARAAAALAPDLAGCVRPLPATARIPLYLAATGQPPEWAAPILAAVASWKAGRKIQAFDDLASGMKAVFPSVVPGLPSLLTDSILPSYARMNDDDWADSETLYKRYAMDRVKTKTQFQKPVLAYFRSMCSAEIGEMPPEELDRCWRTVIELWQVCHGPNPQRDSLAWHWLGGILEKAAKRDTNPFDFDPKGKREGLVKALDAYEKSVASDETNEAAWLALASLLVNQGATKKSDKMLDELVKKFPRNKGVLILAAHSASARKSHAKGAVFLRAALALDPLDRDLKNRLVASLMSRVREARPKGAPTEELWAEIEPLLEDHPPEDHLMLSRWMARVRRSLLDTAPEPIALAELDAIARAPSGLIRVFFTATLASVYRIPSPLESKQEWKAASSSSECTWQSLLEILKLLNFACTISSWGATQTKAARERILTAVGHLGSARKLKEDPEGLLDFFVALQAFGKRASPLISEIIAALRRDICLALNRHVNPATRKTDPWLRLANLTLIGHEPKWALKHVIEVITDAETAGLHAIAARAKVLRKEIELQISRAPASFFGVPSGAAHDEDEVEDSDIWEDEDEDEDEDGPSEVVQNLEALKIAVAAGDDAAIRKIRETLLGLGLTKATINMVVEAISNSKRSSQSRKPGKTGAAKKAAKPMFSDPFQGELF